jgi:catalase
LKVVGHMVLNRWPDNFFAETEQVAYCPANVVPGIDFSNDPLLQGRLFSYLDTQLSRLGSPNFNQIPVNAPKCPFANFQRDGAMQMTPQAGRVSYEPSSLEKGLPQEDPTQGFRSSSAPVDGPKGRLRPESFADHYSQARQFYRSLGLHEQAHIASALVFELSKVEHAHVRQAITAHLRHIDEGLAGRVGKGLGMEALPVAPPTAAPVKDLELSPALRIIGRMRDSLAGRCIGVLASDGSDGAAIKKIREAAAAEGAGLKIVAPRVGALRLSDGSILNVDGQLAGTPSTLFDAVAVILSDEGAKAMAGDSAAVDFVRDAFAHLKAISYDKGGAILVAAAKVVNGLGVVEAGELAAFIAAAKTRQWQREASVRMLA